MKLNYFIQVIGLTIFSLFELIKSNNINEISSINTFNVLSFSGGGAFGAVEIGILNKLIDTNAIVKNYDLYTGISAGGLNAGFLSHFNEIKEGLLPIKNIYTQLTNHQIYEILPASGISLLNTKPLEKTITKILSELKQSNIETMIGTTNLNTGYLDTYYYNQLELNDQIQLLMCTSAIPVAFPPIKFKNQLYVDGGEIQNQLLNPITNINNKFMNITYITPYKTLDANYDIKTFEDIVKRNIQVVTTIYNNEIYRLNQNCDNKKGIIYMYYVDPMVLTNYSMLNFNTGSELIKLGYNNVKYKVYNLC
jgi:NTE family protein